MIDFNGLKAVKGFKFAGVCSNGLKKNIGLLYSTVEDTLGVAIYTRNDVIAAPIVISKKMDELSNKKRAILINSGSSNSFTGRQGLIDGERCILELSKSLKINIEECYIASTGVIGKKLNADSIINNLETLTEKLDEKNSLDFIEATMTTDTKVKQASIKFDIDGIEVTIAGCAKGSGMIMPNMATMLSVLTTDALISHELLKKSLSESAEDTFNCITIDGDMSTNDSIFLLANGVANNKKIENINDKGYENFYNHLKILMKHLSKEIVKDGEGITKFITIDIINTPSRDKAKAVALSIANSPLVKTALFGEDLNWGRILMATGKAMTKMDCSIIDLYINNHLIVKCGEPIIDDEEYKKAKQSLKNRDINILIDFNQGNSRIEIWTCDFSYDYIKKNADYTS
ncbi:bifunctional glutamate N-acetyltransferase/amino-acid acetyltransferase ArgJ [Pelosinus fermentans]|uniref:Arginine biosynthesis bifunctional protein ArgJ n=1 Tax=Pelosinus fermentans JBW45 TaxID=1192197 RepID=I9NRT5_9FIRM|nr:bifunctional glutamate N-acetyltransferase/amino-acid acetyltransferase ArgJ [Pelosinus fermentans]AJQ26583.1 Arginine biosynthesis bifunctional protein ArgJ [Pelosinus fermentans JBW45]